MMTSKKKKGRVIWGKPICIDQRLVFIEEKVVEEWEILVPQVIELEVNSKDGSITWKTFQER